MCEYLETRKQKEQGGGRHMSARAKPQVVARQVGEAVGKSGGCDDGGSGGGCTAAGLERATLVVQGKQK